MEKLKSSKKEKIEKIKKRIKKGEMYTLLFTKEMISGFF